MGYIESSAKKPTRRSCKPDSSIIIGAALVLLWIGINIADGFWLYFYVQAIVNPNPHTAVNRTSAAFDGYQAMMFIFGFVWGTVNLLLCWFFFAAMHDWSRWRGPFTQFMIITLCIVVLVPIALALIILPFFGGWIVTPIVQSWTWNHRCDGYPMFAILDGASYNDPRYIVNQAYFYATGRDEVLYTYEVTNPDDDDVWLFKLRNWDVDQFSIPLDDYPTLQSVQYNFVDKTLSGNCTVASPPSNFEANTTTLPCMTGTFDPGNHLFFNVTSKVPLNNTLNANETASMTNLLRIHDNSWTFSDQPPALILRQVDPETNELGDIVVRTAVAKPHDCTELKVCIAGIDGKEGSQVGAGVMSSLGMILMRQADYAIECTTPSSD